MPVGLARIPDRSGPLTGEPRVRGHRRPSRNPSRGTGDSARDRALLETSLRVSGRLHRPRIRIRRPAAHRAPPLRGRAGSAYRHLPTGADAHASPDVSRSHRHRRPMRTPVSQPSRRHPSDRGGLASAVVIGSAFLSLAATVVLTLAPLTRPDVRTVADQPPQRSTGVSSEAATGADGQARTRAGARAAARDALAAYASGRYGRFHDLWSSAGKRLISR